MNSLVAGHLPSTSYTPALGHTSHTRLHTAPYCRHHSRHCRSAAAPSVLDAPTNAEQQVSHQISALTSSALHVPDSSSAAALATGVRPGTAQSTNPMGVLTSALIAKAVDKPVEEVSSSNTHGRSCRRLVPSENCTCAKLTIALSATAKCRQQGFSAGRVSGRAWCILGDGSSARLPQRRASAMRAVRGRFPGAPAAPPCVQRSQ
jgi:hypothetical protein